MLTAARQAGTGRYRLRCPARCAVPPVNGGREAARIVREHPAVCPDPGVCVGGIHLFVYAERTGR